jgi:hypothetical protein
VTQAVSGGPPHDTAAPGPGSDRTGGGGRCEEKGSGDLARLLGTAGRYPISSSALPFVSFTNFRTNGMESAAKTV